MLEQEYRSLQRLMEIAELRQKGIQDTHLLDWNFRVAEDTPYVQMGKRYVNNWQQVKAENLGLLFWGDVGTGKSFLAACIANGLLDQGVSVMMTNFTRILNKLSDLQVKEANSIAQKHNCNLRRPDYQQEQGLMSSLPLAYNQIEIQRGMTTSSTAIFVPFTTQELFQDGKEALYYGLNALSNNLIMVDRKKLKNPNGLILGTPGSGKSFSAKREITNAFLTTNDDIIVCDPEGKS